MNNITDLNSRRSSREPSISFEELVATTEDTGLAHQVQSAISKTIKVNRPKIKVITPHLRPAQPIHGKKDNFGLFLQIGRKTDVVMTNEDFPNYLLAGGLTKNSALLLAATSLIAYTSVHMWMDRLDKTDPGAKINLVRAAGNKNMHPNNLSFWSQESFHRNIGRPDPHNIMHRMAARIALNTCEIDELTPQDSPPYPDHIAALADPYSGVQTARLYALTTSH